jgi:hypothetical protein
LKSAENLTLFGILVSKSVAFFSFLGVDKKVTTKLAAWAKLAKKGNHSD